MDGSNVQRNTGIDLVKAFAIILVVLMHVSAPVMNAYGMIDLSKWIVADFYNSFTRAAVPLFVMASGYLLLKDERNFVLSVFLKKRFRLVVPFLFWSVIYVFWGAFISGKSLSINDFLTVFYNPAYYHLWFMYMIFGLYLITPILMYFERNISQKNAIYIVVLLFISSSVLNPFKYSSLFIFNNVYLFYFVLGGFLRNITYKKKVLWLFFLLGYLLSFFGVYYKTVISGSLDTFFIDNSNINIFLMAISMFLLIKDIQIKNLIFSSLIISFSKASFGLYIMHIFVFELLDRGYFGFRLSWNTFNPLISIPIIFFVVFSLTYIFTRIINRIPLLGKVVL